MQTALIGKETVAADTVRFTFLKPNGFAHLAGQSIDLTLVNPPETDDEGNTRAFTLSSAPGDERLAITTRMRDTAYKRVLGAMPPETVLIMDGPFGDMTLHERAERPAVFLAGGIGVTPFHAMMMDAAAQPPRKLTLFYANRRPEDAAYLAELSQLAAAHEHFTVVPTMTGMDTSAQEWGGERGYITVDMLSKYGALSDAPMFYIAGPAPMVTAARKTLADAGVSNDDIRFEEFTGY